ncbi:unnamed protein product [Rotaria magnacalcarata]|uniref:Uncharacterized protein n=1 Tax=Rotaria magnacalcarata TaxID=392030 RepID=A0A816XPN3_9BILA|nr:unnamed protein product [Rotaria magnacalcarata]CAF2227330.1 unnamed protein product [Rotaria magnacalcarata]CAF3791529.1 unnamed protein product [Rotaria magnacalcarata]CAF4153474.1 unnamed protein product [Rotaria magnacalcarata]
MCKILLIPIFICIINLFLASAVKCPSCIGIIVDRMNKSLSSSESHCEEIVESAAMCKSELFIELIDACPAVINYITTPSNALITNSADSELVTNINIPLDIGNAYASVIYDCYDKDLCNNNIVEKQYEKLIALNYTQLTIKLTELLYDDQIVTKQQPIECYNRNRKIEKYSINGNCQATLVIQQGRSDLLITTCVSDRRPGSIAGVTLQSKSVGNDYQKTSISYICNRNRCNDPIIMNQIRQILAQFDLINSNVNSLQSFSSVLFIVCMITIVWNRCMLYL